MKKIEKLEGLRWFIWTVVFIVVSMVGLACYIIYVSNNDAVGASAILTGHTKRQFGISLNGKPSRMITTPWLGKWVAGNYWANKILNVSSVTEKNFDFTIEAIYGSHSGGITGKAIISTSQDLATASVKSEDGGSVCNLAFHKNGNVMTVNQINACDGFVGAQVDFSDDYKKDAIIPEPTVKDLMALQTPEQQKAFTKLVGKYLKSFAEEAMVQDEVTDEDGFSARVYQSFINTDNAIRNIIMVTPDSKIWAAVEEYDTSNEIFTIRYFTNVLKYKKQLPQTIDDWIGSEDAKIIYER